MPDVEVAAPVWDFWAGVRTFGWVRLSTSAPFSHTPLTRSAAQGMLAFRSFLRPVAPIVYRLAPYSTSTSASRPLASSSSSTNSVVDSCAPGRETGSQQYVPQQEVLVTALGAVDKRGQIKAGKLKFVLMSNLPTTYTPQDLKQLAPSDKCCNALGRIEFIYDKLMKPTGKALLSFADETHAMTYAHQNFRRPLGNHVLHTRILSANALENFLIQYYGTWDVGYQVIFDLIEYDSAKLVLLSNLPRQTSESRIEERLHLRYDLKPQDRWRGKRVSRVNFLRDSKGYGGSSDVILGSVIKLPVPNPNATVCSFVVRLTTISEAMRLVRRWHNTYYSPDQFDLSRTAGKFRIQASIIY